VGPVSVAVRIPVVDSSQPGEARRVAVSLAHKLGFDETAAGKIAIVVTEGATNLLKHGGGGEILLHAIESAGTWGLDVIAIDRGRGITDISRSMRDGESTSGTSGSGLGAIVRLSASHDLYTQPGQGTAILARFWPSPPHALPTALDVDGFSIPLAGEEVSGDEWTVHHRAGCCRILVVDGLGHGFAASEAAREAIRAFEKIPDAPPVECMEAIHARLRPTRGAAAALTTIDIHARQVSFIGIGNIAGTVSDAWESRSMVSMAGIMGHNVRCLREFLYPWSARSRLVLHSDGLSSRWDLATYPGLMQRAPALAAAVLYRDMARGKDDATVVVARESENPA
jgi:anti-sigma regulatory factor (Ser/Thr protein kinase)